MGCNACLFCQTRPRPLSLDDFTKGAASLLDQRGCSSPPQKTEMPETRAVLQCKQMLVQRPPRIVEFQFECLDAEGAVISSLVDTLLPECTPEATRDVPEPERACSFKPSNSVDATDCTLTE